MTLLFNVTVWCDGCGASIASVPHANPHVAAVEAGERAARTDWRIGMDSALRDLCPRCSASKLTADVLTKLTKGH